MKGGANIIGSVHALKQAHDHLISFRNEHPGTKGAKLAESYLTRINWIVNDLTTHPFLPQVVRDVIKDEWQSDVWAVPAIAEKVVMLEPGQRDNLELLVDALLAGETITATK